MYAKYTSKRTSTRATKKVNQKKAPAKTTLSKAKLLRHHHVWEEEAGFQLGQHQQGHSTFTLSHLRKKIHPPSTCLEQWNISRFNLGLTIQFSTRYMKSVKGCLLIASCVPKKGFSMIQQWITSYFITSGPMSAVIMKNILQQSTNLLLQDLHHSWSDDLRPRVK